MSQNHPLFPPKESVKDKSKQEEEKQKYSEKQERVHGQVTRKEQSEESADRESRQQENQTHVSGVGGYVLAHPRWCSSSFYIVEQFTVIEIVKTNSCCTNKISSTDY